MTLRLRSVTMSALCLLFMLGLGAAIAQEKPMLGQIENGVLARLKEKVLVPARQIEAQKAGSGGTAAKGLSTPSVGVAIEAGRLTALNAAKTVFRADARLFVYMDFASLRDEAAIRQGIYPILLSALSFLSGQTLDLDIKPLAPIQFQNTTDQADIDRGIMTFMLEFETAFTFNKLSDDSASDLLRAGIEYLLKPGDNTADMEGSAGSA